MYSYEERLRAVELYLKYGRRMKAAIRELVDKQTAKRAPLPANLARREVRHEPDSTTCSCGCQLKRIGEDIAEKPDYQPGVFTVERHVRGKWVCSRCQTLI